MGRPMGLDPERCHSTTGKAIKGEVTSIRDVRTFPARSRSKRLTFLEKIKRGEVAKRDAMITFTVLFSDDGERKERGRATLDLRDIEGSTARGKEMRLKIKGGGSSRREETLGTLHVSVDAPFL